MQNLSNLSMLKSPQNPRPPLSSVGSWPSVLRHILEHYCSAEREMSALSDKTFGMTASLSYKSKINLEMNCLLLFLGCVFDDVMSSSREVNNHVNDVI